MWADQHHYLTGAALARAIQADQLPWDPSVQALLPFPSVLEMMSSDMNWTSQIGNAFLAQQPDVMDAVQRERRQGPGISAISDSNAQIVVGGGPYITIMPANPAFMVVPYYDPGNRILRAAAGIRDRRRDQLRLRHYDRGVFPALGLGRGSAASIGAPTRCSSTTIRGAALGSNRALYVHPYEGVRRVGPGSGRPAEAHRLEGRSPAERESARQGRRVQEEHRH